MAADADTNANHTEARAGDLEHDAARAQREADACRPASTSGKSELRAVTMLTHWPTALHV
eukprot:CAMPEP_0204353754 /NCGR_PEP_ID=MMETSP0469-20131031/32900_1 /ASSEMBLY_ACC=CAM_ASM_000384 /TAXON_ID=2969 /ORGANISM="Oxyrrhis marina" /LENGTH=59 /DNA_ID=CAMNT_0051340727 /DNA_START=109 /DNA_END=284 /DNA_ORIENTATION=-